MHRIVVLVLLATLFVAGPGSAAHQQIRIAEPVSDLVRAMTGEGELELMGDDDGAVVLLATEEAVAKLRGAGETVEVLVEDLEAFYAARIREGSPPVAGDNFGIFHTYSETVDALNQLHAEFPTITTAPFSIGTTGEGRTIWAIKVSDNPDVDEPEAEVLFDGVHHAREIMTVEMLLDFSRYLCEGYGTDPVASMLVDSREIFFVPVVNPDGFVYNETTDPAGGGLWRKNRRVNAGSSCRGVDLNRNYDFQWIGSGSSTDPCSETFRGPSANSEPEIVALTSFINAHDFVVWQSYHSVAGMVLFPWGYTDTQTADDATFREMAAEMAAANGYQTGQPGEILYFVNGASFDWGYGRTDQHSKIFGFTTEISGSGFWPAPAERDPLVAENLPGNLYLCRVAGSWLELVSIAIDDGIGGNDALDPGETVTLTPTVRNVGVLMAAPSVESQLSVEDPYLLVEDASASFGSIAAGTEEASGDPFQITVDPRCPEGRAVTLSLLLTSGDGLSLPVTASFTVGSNPAIASATFEAGTSGWTIDPTDTATSGDFVRIDPNPTSFQPGDDTTPDPGVFAWVTGQNSSEGTDDVDNGIAASRSGIVNLSAYEHVRLDLNYFFGQRDSGDDAQDFFRIDVSNNGGATFPVNLVSVGDQLSPAVWHNLVIDLEEVISLTSLMMIRVQAADGTAQGDLIEAGIDDVFFLDRGDGNEAPGAPSLVSPLDGAENVPALPALVVSNAVDPEGAVCTYGFRIFSDAAETELVAEVEDVPQGVGTTSWTPSTPLAPGAYVWRAYADDGALFGAYMAPAHFTVGEAADVEDGAVAGRSLTAFPNPTRGAVSIRYYTESAPLARLDVLDAGGRRIRSLESPRWTDGWQEISWDARDERGTTVPAGVYWVRLVTPHETRTVQLVRVD